MKRRIAFLLIVMLVLGMLAGCKSNEDEFSISDDYIENDQVFAGDEVGEDIDKGNEQEQDESNPETPQKEEEKPSKNEADKKPQQKPEEQNTPDSAPEVNEQEEETPDSEPEEEQEEEPSVGEGGGPLYSEGENPYKDSLKILAFGNSFSKDAMRHLWDIAKSYGVKNVVLGNLNIGGCSLDTHYTNMTQDAAVYTYSKNTTGEWVNSKNTTATYGLQDEDWDIITIQQASDQSGDPFAFDCLSGIVKYLEQRKPKKDTKILWHMTWAYQSDSKKSAFEKYNNDQTKMYEAILERVKEDVLSYDDFVGVIPAGTAIQNLRKTAVGDTLTRDGYHLSYGMGRYVAGLTWYCYITGADPEETPFVPSEDQAEIYLYRDEINQAVADAIRSPYEVTKQ